MGKFAENLNLGKRVLPPLGKCAQLAWLETFLDFPGT